MSDESDKQPEVPMQPQPWRRNPRPEPESYDVTVRDGVRYDKQNRRLCGAHRKNGSDCHSPAMMGARVCRMHGGSTPQSKRKARLRLAELVDPAIATLAREMVKAERSSDRQRAANSVLDRAGFSRSQKVELDDAKAVLRERLREIKSPEADGGEAAEQAYDFTGTERPDTDIVDTPLSPGPDSPVSADEIPDDDLNEHIRALEADGAGALPEPRPLATDDDDED